MKKLHILRNGEWLPVFAAVNGHIVTCERAPQKALPPKAIWAKDDLAWFRSKFSNEQFELRNIA